MTPRVAVVMPVFNAERFVRSAIDSILAQTFRDFELIIVDDASTDRTAAIIASYGDARIRRLRSDRNGGVAAALNIGMRHATAGLIARQDADDVSDQRRLALQIDAFEHWPSLALLGTQGTIVDENNRQCGEIDRSLEPASIRWHALIDNPFVHSSVMFRRSAFDACGGYLERPKPFPEDYALWSRMIARFEARNLPDRLVRYRASAASTFGSLAYGSAQTEYVSAYAEVLRGLVAGNLAAVFGDAVSTEDVALLARYVPGLRSDQVPAFGAVFERLLAEYERVHPAETATRDFKRTLARQYDAIAFRVTPPARLRSLSVYAQALSRRPGLAAVFGWRRAIALTVLGQAARRRASDLRSVRSRAAA